MPPFLILILMRKYWIMCHWKFLKGIIYLSSGKTTLAYCLLGLFELNEGSLKVNNININDVNKSSYTNRISAIFQDFMRYKYTVRDNIGMENFNNINNNGKIYNVVMKVGMLNKIENFEK